MLRRWMLLLTALVGGGAAALALAVHDDGPTGAAAAHPPSPPETAPLRPAAPKPTRRLVIRPIGALPVPLRDVALTSAGGTAYGFGGLAADDSSSSSVIAVGSRGVRSLPPLPVALHDAAAAAIRGRLFVLGGGGAASFPGIGSYRIASGTTRLVGSLPTPLSDLSAVTVGRIVYVIGGYTGATFSDRILAYSGHGRPRVVARLPQAVRYAAVAATGTRIVIAGGRTPTGATADVVAFDTASGRVTTIGRLPEPLMHASAATLDGVVYVVGGQSAAGAPTRWVLSIDAAGRVRRALRLPAPLSDAGVAAAGERLVIVGGFDGSQPVRRIAALQWTAVRHPPAGSTPGSVPAGAAPAVPAMFRGPLPGDLLIADRGNNRLLIVNPDHRVVWRFPGRPGQAHLNFDDDSFFAPGGRRIIMNEEHDHRVLEVSYPGGRVTWSYGHAGVAGASPGYLNTPDDAYALPGGRVIVADAYNCRVLELRGHRILRSIGQAGRCVHDPPRSLGPVNGDTPLPNGDVLVSEINGSYIDEFTLGGRLVRVYRAPVRYPSDPQLTRRGNILLADFSRPGAAVILSRRTGRVLWRYRVTSGWGMLDHPSLAAMLPNGMIALNDDYNDRVVVIDPATKKIVWWYGARGIAGTSDGRLNTPDGFDFIPVTASGLPDPSRIVHGPPAR